MARTVKKGVTFYPTFDTQFDQFKAESGFEMEITNMADGSVVTNAATGTFAEVMWTDPGHSGTTSGDTAAGANQITLASGNTLVAGDRFDDGAGNIYYVVDATDTSVTIKGSLVAAIADGTDLNSVGNTGIYKVDVQIDTIGEYLVAVNHKDYGHYAIKYTVSEHNEDDIYDRLDSGLTSLGATKRLITIA